MNILNFLTVSILTFIVFPSIYCDEYKHYHGYKLVKAIASGKDQLKAIKKIQDESRYDFWDELSPRGTADILVSPQELPELLSTLEATGINYSIMIEDLEKIISTQREEAKMKQQDNPSMNWENYQNLNTISKWLNNLTLNYPEMITFENIGWSWEGRQLGVYKVSTGGTNKTAFWMDATIHAREWVSTSSITYFINELVTKSSNYSDILSQMDFYFQPIVNPDGYFYTHETDRMWRKTRSNHNFNTTCRGVDANRNFELGFGGTGSSGDPCSETYRGPYNYSEPEAKAVRDYISRNSDVDWSIFITIHSYSQLWMCPYGYTLDRIGDYAELKNMSDIAVAALTSVHNTEYETGSSAEILYLSAGSSRDWAYGIMDIPWVYTIELRDTGRFGFVLPPEQIIPTAVETWAGVQKLAREVLMRRNKTGAK